MASCLEVLLKCLLQLTFIFCVACGPGMEGVFHRNFSK